MLTNYRAFDKEALAFRQQRQESKRLEEKLNKSIERELVDERAKGEHAIREYEKKLQDVMHNKRGEIKKIESYHRKMSGTLEKTFKAFEESVKAIQGDPSITDEREKIKKIDAIANKITSSLFTKEEAEQFKKFASSMVIILPSDRLQMSRMHRPQIKDSGSSRVTYL